MSTLSNSLLYAAEKADAEAFEAIDAGDPEWAERCLLRAAQFRRLATNHQAKAILSGDPTDDPKQVAPPSSGISGPEIQARRMALGMTQEALAQALDVTQPTLSRWEHDASPVAHPGMLRLALEALEGR